VICLDKASQDTGVMSWWKGIGSMNKLAQISKITQSVGVLFLFCGTWV
jgi:hypothetical protein